MQRTQIYIDEQDHQKLSRLAADAGKSMSEIIRVAIKDFLIRKNFNSRLNALQQARGIWHDRMDLKVFDDLRNELNRD